MSILDPMKKAVYFTGKFLHKNMPTILSVIACGGVVGTAITSANAHHKAMQKLEESEPLPLETPTEKVVREVKMVTPHYILPAVVGGCTIALILGSNALNKKQQAALYGALFALDKSYRTYREKVNFVLGSDADTAIKNEIAKDRIRENDIPKPNSKDEVLFYEENSDQFFWSTMEDVQMAEYHFNRNFVLRGEASLNELLEFYGAKPCEFGDILGWDQYEGEITYGYRWVDFEHEWKEVEEGDFEDDDLRFFKYITDTPGYYYIRTPFPAHTPSDPDETQCTGFGVQQVESEPVSA